MDLVPRRDQIFTVSSFTFLLSQPKFSHFYFQNKVQLRQDDLPQEEVWPHHPLAPQKEAKVNYNKLFYKLCVFCANIGDFLCKNDVFLMIYFF